MRAEPINYALFFCTKDKFYTFFTGDYHHFNAILKTGFQNLFEKSDKKR